MKYTKLVMLFLALVMLGGCTANINKFDFGQEGKIDPDGEPGSTAKVTNVMVFYVKDSPLTTRKNQEADSQFPVSLNGSNAATGELTSPTATFNPVTIAEDVRKVINTIDPPEEQTPATKLPSEVIEDNDDASSSPRVFEMKPYKNKSLTWMSEINYKDSSGPLTFTFDGGCGSFVVPDVKHIWGEDGNSNNHNQRFYFSGDPKEQEDTHGSGKPTGSVFTAPGCTAKTVTVTRG